MPTKFSLDPLISPPESISVLRSILNHRAPSSAVRSESWMRTRHPELSVSDGVPLLSKLVLGESSAVRLRWR